VRATRAFFLRPVVDTLRGLERCLEERGLPALAWIALGLLAGWWVYVPVHELAHAGACLAAGGAVSRLEIDPLYAGALLARAIPWVEPGGEYAGRLSGFDTHGSDLVYLATDLGPFAFTVWPGVWLLRRAAAGRWPLAFGLALPWALAPFLSVAGDAYEIGSILVTRLPPWAGPATRELLRGDDLAKVIGGVSALPAGAPWGGLALGAALGLAWAWGTYGLGGLVAGLVGEGPVGPEEPLPGDRVSPP
jgi:hypothetical protein